MTSNLEAQRRTFVLMICLRLPLPLQGASNLGQEQVQYWYAVHQISSLPMTAERIARENRRDRTLSQVITFTLNGWPRQVQPYHLQAYFCKRHKLSVELGCLLCGGQGW